MSKNTLSISIFTIFLIAFVGCSSSSDESSTSSEVSKKMDSYIQQGYRVVVERGSVFGADVVDSKGRVATQIDEGNNTYLFDRTPAFPIKASGGWIDVDGDKELTSKDVSLDVELTSYSDVITPTTTYIADKDPSKRAQKLQELRDLSGSSDEDLLKLPSKADRNSVIVTNAIYERLVEKFADKNNTNAKSPIAISEVTEKFNEIDATIDDDNTSNKVFALNVESKIIDKLKDKGFIGKLKDSDIDFIKGERPTTLKEKVLAEIGVTSEEESSSSSSSESLSSSEASSSESSDDGTLYAVTLDTYGDNKLNVIKAVKEITGLGLVDAKYLVDSAPVVVLEGLSYDDATTAISQLEDAGATVTMTSEGAVSSSSESSSVVSDDGSLYTVTLDSIGGAKLNVVKAVKEITGLGLAEAKSLVDSAPSTILEDASYDEAITAISQLEDAGATASMVSDGTASSSSESSVSSDDGSLYTVTIDSIGGSKLNVVKAVKEITGLGLVESKYLVDGAPSVILEGASYDEAISAISKLEDVGATASMESEGTGTSSSESSSSISSDDGSLYSVTLDSIGGSKLNVVKAVKEITGLGLADAKYLVDSAPAVILEGASYDEATSAISKLEDVGATATMTSEGTASSSSTSSASSDDGSLYTVTLDSVGGAKLNVVKAVKEITGLGLAEAKSLVDSAPSTILEGASYDEAISVISQLEEVGATASMTSEGTVSSSSESSTSSDDGSLYTVTLDSVGGSKLNVVKALKEITGYGLVESKYLADSAPSVILEGASYDEASSVITTLEEVGATASMEAE